MTNRLKELREERGDTQKKLAALFGVTEATYCKKELGYIKVSLEEAYIASRYFGLTIAEIFFADAIS